MKKYKPRATTNHSLSPKLIWMNNLRIRVRFKGSWLKQDKITFVPKYVVSLFIVYELDRWLQNVNTDFTLKDCLFGVVKLTKNAGPDKCSFSEYGIGFDSC